MEEDLIERVDFEIIRYANCWEDADILIKGLSPKQGNKILSIGSAGDNSFSLLASNPELIVAIDVNDTQLYLIELKKLCFKKLSYEEMLQFLGFNLSNNRKEVFNSLKNDLSAEAKAYWEKNIEHIISGIIYQGKFEKYFKLFSSKILPWIHSSKKTAELFNFKTQKEQELFYNEKWNSWRWRLLFKLFFSKYVMGKFGRDPEFLKEVKVTVSDYIYNKAGMHLQSIEAQKNFILHFNLRGNFGDLLPNYLQREKFEIIKTNINNLKIKKGYAQSAINEFGKFNCMNLSNIFEYMDANIFKQTSETLINGTEQDGSLAYWNLMVPRKISEIFPEKVIYQEELSNELTAIDKGFFYNKFIVDKIK